MTATKRAAAVAVSKVSALADEVRAWGGMRQTGVSLKDMMEFGARGPKEENLVHLARFLHRELPIRIARRVVELEDLPLRLSSKTPVLKVRDWYMDSFRDLRSFPAIKSSSDDAAFTRMIKNIKVRHNNVVQSMAMGINQLKKELGPRVSDDDLGEIQGFLDRFYLSRIGIRMLIGQHVALHEDGKGEPADGRVVGQIDGALSPVLVAQNAAEDARSLCLREYGSAPDINIYGDPEFRFPYVSDHLHLMVFELVKNSLRAVQERYMNSEVDPPTVRIVVADGIEDVTIKVSDEGGGIPRSGLPKIFTYLYSTAKTNPLDEYSQHGAVNGGCTMAGYGYGLPISRLYARYFGGDLQVISMEGYGTDAYLHLCRLGDSHEPLP